MSFVDPNNHELRTTYAFLPVDGVGHLVVSLDSSEESVDSGLPDALVVVKQQSQQSLNRVIEERHESRSGGLEDLPEHFGRDLFLDGDLAVDIHESVEVLVVVLVLALVAILERNATRGGTRVERSNGLLDGSLVGLAFGVVELVGLALLAALDKRRDGLGQVRSELLLKDTSHGSEEHQSALLHPRTLGLKTVDGVLHQISQVRSEDLPANDLGECAKSVDGDSSQGGFLTLTLEEQERYNSLGGLQEVGLETFLGSKGSRTDGSSDSDLDADGSGIKQANKLLHQQSQVAGDVVTQDFEICLEGSSSRLLGVGILDKLEQSRDEMGVPVGTLFLQPLAHACKSDTTSLPHGRLGVGQTAVDQRPELGYMRSDELAASLDSDTESHQSGFSHSGVLRGHVSLQLRREDREDLLRRQSLGELVEGSESKLSGRESEGDVSQMQPRKRLRGRDIHLGRVVIVIVVMVLLTTDGQKTLDDNTSEAERLNLALFAVRSQHKDQFLSLQHHGRRLDSLLNGPTQTVESGVPDILLGIGLASDGQTDLDVLLEVLGDERSL